MNDCTLYHGTDRALPTGRWLTAHEVDDSWVDRYFALARPKAAPNRSRSFFLGEDPSLLVSLGAGSVEHVYEVEADAKAIRTDPAWVEHALEVIDAVRQAISLGYHDVKAEKKLMGFAASYWAGKRAPGHTGWEWISPRMFVCREVGSPPQRPRGHWRVQRYGQWTAPKRTTKRRRS